MGRPRAALRAAPGSVGLVDVEEEPVQLIAHRLVELLGSRTGFRAIGPQQPPIALGHRDMEGAGTDEVRGLYGKLCRGERHTDLLIMPAGGIGTSFLYNPLSGPLHAARTLHNAGIGRNAASFVGGAASAPRATSGHGHCSGTCGRDDGRARIDCASGSVKPRNADAYCVHGADRFGPFAGRQRPRARLAERQRICEPSRMEAGAIRQGAQRDAVVAVGLGLGQGGEFGVAPERGCRRPTSRCHNAERCAMRRYPTSGCHTAPQVMPSSPLSRTRRWVP